MILKDMIERHAELTNSRRAREILEKMGGVPSALRQDLPKEYRRALGELAAAQRKAAA